MRTISPARWPEKPVRYQFDVDPLIFLVMWRRKRINIFQHEPYHEIISKSDYYRVAEPELVLYSQEDVQTAADIRNYYNSKITMLGLQGKPLSNFRKSLHQVVCNEFSLDHEELALLYKLPEFYSEDLFIDSVIEKTKNPPDLTVQSLESDFEYLGSTVRSTRRYKEKRYWFRSQEGYLARFVTELRCSAQNIIDQYLLMGHQYNIDISPVLIKKLTGVTGERYYFYINHDNYSIKQIAGKAKS